jgi:hypothetical protein
VAVVSLSEAVGYAAALINAADWLTATDAVLNGTTTVMSASANFTQADRGKYVSIAGAMTGGKPFIGYIDTVTSESTIVLSSAVNNSGTNFSMSYGGVSEDPRHPLWKITQAVLQKDIEICNAILATANHPRRNFFTFTTSSTAQTNTGVPFVSRSGLVRMVEVQHTDTVWRVGKQLTPEWLPRLTTWISNRSSLFTAASQGYYCIHNGQLYFTGTNIRVTYVDLAITPTACQAPQEYTNAIAILAVADLFATEGDDLNATQMLAKLGAESAAALITEESA